MKMPVQLYLDGELVRILKSRGVNISETVNAVMLNIVNSESVTSEELALAMLVWEKNGQQQLIDSAQRQQVAITKNIEVIDEKIKKQMVIVEEVKRSERIAGLMKEVNDALLSSSFEEVLSSPVVESLRKEGIPVDERWLRRQLQRLDWFR